MGLLFNLPKSNSNADKSTSLKFRLYLADMNDVDVENWPSAVNATLSTNPLKANKTFKYIDLKLDSIKPSAAAGESPFGGKTTIEAVYEGVSKAALSWLYSNVGNRFIAIWERCLDGVKFIAGSPCSDGLLLKYSSIGSQDGGVSGVAITLEGGECPEPILFYEGGIPQEAATALTVTDGSAALTAGKSAYVLTDNAADTSLTGLTGVTDSDVNRVIELRGAGVTHPTSIANSATFILNNGVAFCATVGSVIFLQIGKSGANYTFTEVFRG